MKKLMIAAAIVCAAALSQAASVGWSCAGLTSIKDNTYQLFVYNTAAEGADYDAFKAAVIQSLNAGEMPTGAFASGTIPTNGTINQPYGSSGKTLGEGTWKAFFVMFDSASPKAGESKYAIVGDGAANMTKALTTSTANTTFGAANQQTYVTTDSNWKSYGAAPEPTSGLLLLLGVAGLALKRRRA